MRSSNWVMKKLENQLIPKLRNCTSFKELSKIHGRVIVSSLSDSNFLATQIIHVCNTNKRIDYAELVFKQVKEPNVFLYNSIIRALTQNTSFLDAMILYKKMLVSKDSILADRFTYPFVLKASAGLLLLHLGAQIHTHVLKYGLEIEPVVQNSLIEMYTKCDDLMDARKVFDEMSERDVVSWNTLISAYARSGKMRKARALFDLMQERTVVSWTALISGYTLIGSYSEAVDIFHQMQLSGMEPDDISIVSILPACAQLGALELGKWIHVYADKHRLLWKTYVCNALIEMYSKCGTIDEARQLFDRMLQRDVISWTTMIVGLASHGRACEAVKLFAEMETEGRVKPNCITFLGVLSACAHAGLLDEGLKHFELMGKIYGLAPEVEHYGCMIDLLGRSGKIAHAVEMIENMAMPPDAAIWGSLLGACRMHGNAETATIALENLLEFEPEDTGNYVLLSNIYAAAGRWDDVARMRKLIRTKSMKKTPGCSLIEVNNVVREFISSDDSKPEFGEIVEMLELIQLEGGEQQAEDGLRFLSKFDELESEHGYRYSSFLF